MIRKITITSLWLFFVTLLTSCEKWRINKYDELIVGNWEQFDGISFGGSYNFMYAYTDDGIFTVYKNPCSRDKVYEGPYSYKIDGTSLFIIKSSTQTDTFQIKKLTKSKMILAYVKNSSLNAEKEYLKCD